MCKLALFLACVALLGTVHPLRIAGVRGKGDISINAMSRDVNDLRYIYYETLDKFAAMDYNSPISMEGALIPSNRPVVITIDGFLSNTTSPMTSVLRQSYIEEAAQSLIVLDWSKLSGSEETIGYAGVANPVLLAGAYLNVLGNVELVGQRLGQFLELLEESKGIPMSEVTIVGGSLGAHIAGIAGSYLRNKYGVAKVGRIIGLDPAGPFFSLQLDQNKRLTKGDAIAVHIYHSSRGGLGDTAQDTGDINVYLNGGSNQPGCTVADLTNTGVCSHSYAFQLFNAAFKEDIGACPCSGLACTCKICRHDCVNPIKLGPGFPTGARGRYYASYGAF